MIERYQWVRNTAVKLLLEIAGDGIGGIRYLDTGGLRFIDGKEYDDLVSNRKRLRELKETENKIRSDLTGIHKDVSKFIYDAVTGRVNVLFFLISRQNRKLIMRFPIHFPSFSSFHISFLPYHSSHLS
jgi:hypothetical protein